MPVKIVRTDNPHRMLEVIYFPDQRTGRPNPKRPLGAPRRGALLASPDRQFVLGLDLGQANDFTALVLLELMPDGYAVVLIARTRGKPYPEIVERVVELMATSPLAGNTRLVVDATGVGRPVLDMLRASDLEPLAITITGGTKVSGNRRIARVPKRDLITALLLAFQTGIIKIAHGLEHARTLVSELGNVRRRMTLAGSDQYGVWREGEHDDLVLALALAVWLAERTPRAAQLARPEPPTNAVGGDPPLTPDTVLEKLNARQQARMTRAP